MNEIIIIGAGGNSKVVIDIIHHMNSEKNEFKILGILDDVPKQKTVMGYPVLGLLDDAPKYQKKISFINGIGNNKIRSDFFVKHPELTYFTAIHPNAIIGDDVKIGMGSMIMPGAIINTGTKIGKGCIVNTGAVIEHDNRLGDFVHIASTAATAGNVEIGGGTMLGTGAKVIQGITIGADVMIGAGSVVLHDIPDECTAVGVPAKIIKYKKEE